MSATVYSFATGEATELPLLLLERIVEKAEGFHNPRFYQCDVMTLHRAWTKLKQPFGATLDNHPTVCALWERFQAVVEKSGIFAGDTTPKADDPARLIHKLQQELAAA